MELQFLDDLYKIRLIECGVMFASLGILVFLLGIAKRKLNGFYSNFEQCERNGHYFLQALADQTQRLLLLADQTEKELEIPNLSEEIIGKIRSASGKARLLVSQKMQQFKGLCTNNINQSGTEQFPTTNQDLQGFWDMVMLQVNQVDALFAEIDLLRKNNWKEIPPADTVDSKPVNGSKAKKSQLRPRPAATSVNEEARKQREAQRKKMLEERRKAMRAQQQSKRCEDIEIFVPESS